MVRILLTHGRGLKARDQDKLRAKFVRYMQEGLEAAGYRELDDNTVDFLYYGDVLERPEVLAEESLAASLDLPDTAAGASVRHFALDDDVESLRQHLSSAGGADARVCSLVEERAARAPSVTDETDPPRRQAAMDAALEDRTIQLLDNPKELLSVLEHQFGADFDDDEVIKRGIRDLDERLGENPRETAARRAAEEGAQDDLGRIDGLLREWIVDPATDAIAGLRAVSRIFQEHGVDVRTRLSTWQGAAVSELLTRFEGTDFGRQWATIFDVIAVIANNSMLDGIFIARRMADVENYFRDASIRNDVRAYFRDTLHGREQPTIVVAHSLGSVIAYDVMREYTDLDVSGFVTLGSPLSIGHFRRNVAREGESGNNLPVPETIAEWVNVYSEMDPLTLGSGIERWFQGGGDEAGRGPVDRKAENTGYLDAHSPDQYLSSSVTAAALIQMIAEATVRGSA